MSAAGSLNVHLHRLRGELGEGIGAVSRLATSSHGYTLVVEDGELDSAEFSSRVERARHLAAGDPWAAVVELDAALGLWRGRAFGNLDDIDDIVAARASMEATRAAAASMLADALLASGQESRVVTEAQTWMSWAPYSEHLAGRQALALYRSGDQVEALRWCREFSDRLRNELGLDPTPDFQGIETSILDHSLDGHRPPPATAAAPTATRSAGLVEREAVFAQVHTALDGAGQSSVVIALSGEAGVGKTAVLRAIGDGLPDALRLWPSRQSSPLATVHALAAQVSPGADLPADRHPDAIAAWLAHALAERTSRVILWDDIEQADVDSVAILRQVARRVDVSWVTTARSGDPSLHPLLVDRSLLDGAVRIELAGLSSPGLADLAANMNVHLSDSGVADLGAQTGGNPFLARALLRSPEWHSGTGAPATAIEHIRRLIAEVGADAAEWYSLAAIDLSDTVDLHVVCQAADVDLARGVEVAEAGLAVGLLTERSGELRFRHDLVRESAIGNLSITRRRVLHERLARALLDTPGAAIARVAHHLRASHVPQLRHQAADFTARQGAEERAAGALIASAAHYREAADLVEEIDWSKAADFRLEACDSLVLAGRTSDSQDHATAVADRARHGADRALFVRAAVKVVGPYLATGDTARRAEAHLVEAMEWCRADGAEFPAELCEAVARQTTDRTDTVASRLREAVRPYLERYSETGSAGDRYLGLVGRRHLGWADGMPVAERRLLLTECLRLAVSSSSLHNELRVLWSLASDSFLAADTDAPAAVDAYAARADAAGSTMHRWASGLLGAAVASAYGDESLGSRHRHRIDEVAGFVDAEAEHRAGLLTVLAEAVRNRHLATLAAAADEVDVAGEEFAPLVELAKSAIRRAAGEVVNLANVTRQLTAGAHGTVLPAACALACLSLGEGDAEVAALIGTRLAPWSGTMVLIESGFATLGPADAYLSRCADLTGDVARGDYHRAATEQVTSRFAKAWAGWSVGGG